MSARNDQWMPSANVTYLEDRVARLERMTAHLFRALHEAQASNKAKFTSLNNELRPRLAALETGRACSDPGASDGAPDAPEATSGHTAPGKSWAVASGFLSAPDPYREAARRAGGCFRCSGVLLDRPCSSCGWFPRALPPPKPRLTPYTTYGGVPLTDPTD